MGRASHRVPILIEKSAIHFPKGYYFSVSPLHSKKKLLASEIQEVHLNTFPPSVLTKSKEIVFLKNGLRLNLEYFARLHRLPIVDRFDVWEHLNRPFLDTTFDENEKRLSLKKLQAAGFNQAELKRIRKRIAPTMLRNMLVWEYRYLGLFDYLDWAYLTTEKYQWAMSIALSGFGFTSRSFKKSVQPSPKDKD
jgi:hypothetical protein